MRAKLNEGVGRCEDDDGNAEDGGDLVVISIVEKCVEIASSVICIFRGMPLVSDSSSTAETSGRLLRLHQPLFSVFLTGKFVLLSAATVFKGSTRLADEPHWKVKFNGQTSEFISELVLLPVKKNGWKSEPPEDIV